MEHYHRTYAAVNLDAVQHNVRALQARLAPNTKIMAVIKADGYGHGALALARFLQDHVAYYGIAVLEEALQLRLGGINSPLLILGYTSPTQYDAIIQNEIAQTIYTYSQAEALSQCAKQLDKPVKVHIAVDTGMSRIGFLDCEDSIQEIQKIASLPYLELEGIYTHFACADERDKTPTLQQYDRFQRFCDALKALGITFSIQHCCNSAAAIDFSAHMDMVRFGISLYGLYPSEEVQKDHLILRPAMAWKTHVAHIKTLPAGYGVSYNHTYVTTRPTRIATLPVGYADGYPRALSGQGRVLIHGQYAPILGRICMDQFMVDVSNIDGVQMEDDVTLMGTDGSNCITAEEIGAMSASFNYEVVCRVSQRVPRIYFADGKMVDFHSVFVTKEVFEAQANQ